MFLLFQAFLECWPFAFFSTLDSLQCTFISFLLAIITVCFPPGSLRRRASLLLQVTFVVQAYVSPPPCGIADTATLYMYGVLLGSLTACYFDRLYSCSPEGRFYRIGEEIRWEDSKGRGLRGLVRKFFWALELFTVRRGVGWNWKISSIPASKKETRAEFVRLRLIKWVLMYSALYVTAETANNILNDFKSITDPKLQAALVSVVKNDIFLYFFIFLGSSAIIYGLFGIPMLSLQILCVGLHIGPRAWQDPEAWPPNFGRISEAYSIRRLWGVTWHQQLRRITSAPGVHFLSKAPSSFLQSQTLISQLLRRYFLTFSAFLISGAIHGVGNYRVTYTMELPLSDGNEVLYFLAQAGAIVLEDFILWLFAIQDQGTKPPSKLRKVVGYSVVAVWWVWSRVALKAVPSAAARGFHDQRGPLYAAVHLVLTEAVAGPGNFVGKLVNSAPRPTGSIRNA